VYHFKVQVFKTVILPAANFVCETASAVRKKISVTPVQEYFMFHKLSNISTTLKPCQSNHPAHLPSTAYVVKTYAKI
jgi:hypothetical protein